jgi:hypothetical protein
VSSLFNSDDKLSEKNRDTCLYCDELSFERQKTKLVLLSYEKVMKLLQEEVSNKELSTQLAVMKKKVYYDEHLQDPASKGDWKEVTLNKNKNSKVYNRNLIQLIAHTTNKFGLLTNVKEGRETSVLQARKKKLQT